MGVTVRATVEYALFVVVWCVLCSSRLGPLSLRNVTGWGWDVCTGRIVARSAVLYLILLDPAPILLALAQGRFETLVPNQTPSGFPIE